MKNASYFTLKALFVFMIFKFLSWLFVNAEKRFNLKDKVKKIRSFQQLVSLPHFLDGSWIKIFVLLHSINWPNFIVWLLSLRDVLGNMWVVIVSEPGSDVINFEINLIFLINSVFLHDQKVKTKIYITWEQKENLRWNKKHFSSFLKSFHWKKK